MVLSARGPVAILAFGIAGATVLGALAVAAGLSQEPLAPSAELVSLASSALAWGAGVAFAFAGASGSFARDRREGVTTLATLRGASSDHYALARTAGIGVWLAVLVGGGTLLVGLASAVTAPTGMAGLRILQGLGASLVYAAAFAVVLSLVAMAALAARARAGGYLALVGVLLVPELIAEGARTATSGPWPEVLSLPGALDALRGGLMPGSVDLFRTLRAAVALVVIGGLALLALRLQARTATKAPPLWEG